MADDRLKLMNLINSVLTEKTTVADFCEQFEAYYFSDVPLDHSFDEREAEFFSAIAERFEYAASLPDAESRHYGYVSYAEALEWLRKQMKRFEEGETKFTAF